mmetsp:Transcript_31012/g.77576  ORF Transcript_31012/g.77576 Transcript_31012/m.77576 type:complete len:207 (-) Transcript_31012:880-1500(-)
MSRAPSNAPSCPSASLRSEERVSVLSALMSLFSRSERSATAAICASSSPAPNSEPSAPAKICSVIDCNDETSDSIETCTRLAKGDENPTKTGAASSSASESRLAISGIGRRVLLVVLLLPLFLLLRSAATMIGLFVDLETSRPFSSSFAPSGKKSSSLAVNARPAEMGNSGELRGDSGQRVVNARTGVVPIARARFSRVGESSRSD